MSPSADQASTILIHPTVPVRVDPSTSIRELVQALGKGGFQGRSLSTALDVWERMVADRECTIFFGLSGAMVPAGMRELLVYLIEHRFIDVIVSTGANLFHDIHETLGNKHFLGSPETDDELLAQERIDRMYDVLASETQFREVDRLVVAIAASLDSSRPWTTRALMAELGRRLAPRAVSKGVVVAAARAGVPIYVPALGDSSFGIALASGRAAAKCDLQIDVVGDVVETARLYHRSRRTGVLYVGGGTPKNYIQQTPVTSSVMGERDDGHTYAVQITTDAPHWGGLSGCTFSEARSWGKIASEASTATVYADATIALPVLANALSQAFPDGRRGPRFTFAEGADVAVEYP